jgi:outer membrane protein TolC
LRSEQERASSALDLAKKEARQDITLGYSHERNGVRVGEAVNVLFIALPIQLWNRNEGDIARAEASIVASSAQHDQAIAELSQHLTAARARAESAREQTRLYRELVSPEIDANLALLLRAYEEGEIDLVTASMGRAKLLEAEARELQNRQIYLDARLDIEALVGPTKSEDVKE